MNLRSTAGILAEIVSQKQLEVKLLSAQKSELQSKAEQNRGTQRPFAQALRYSTPAVIAEVKKASPSRGLLQPNFDPVRLAVAYEQGGAACLSVLTDEQYFQGSLADLTAAREATILPVLRKDFVIDPVQIYQAAAHGADAILLIAAILEAEELRTFRQLAAELGLAALVEVHNHEELDRALQSSADLIGVNNRNLETFEVSLNTSLRLSKEMPAEATRVSESGIFTRSDLDLLRNAGFHAFLIGESLMKANNPVGALRALVA